jgi:hypothetical protein
MGCTYLLGLSCTLSTDWFVPLSKVIGKETAGNSVSMDSNKKGAADLFVQVITEATLMIAIDAHVPLPRVAGIPPRKTITMTEIVAKELGWDKFNKLTEADKSNLLVSAGAVAKEAYMAKHKREPPRVGKARAYFSEDLCIIRPKIISMIAMWST